MFPESAQKCIVFLPPFLLKIPRLSALVPRNMGWPPSVKNVESTNWLHCPIFTQVCNCAFHTICLVLLDRGMTNVLVEIFSRNLGLLTHNTV